MARAESKERPEEVPIDSREEAASFHRSVMPGLPKPIRGISCKPTTTTTATTISLHSLLSYLNNIVYDYLQAYTRSLKFDAKPDIPYLRKLFRDLYHAQGCGSVVRFHYLISLMYCIKMCILMHSWTLNYCHFAAEAVGLGWSGPRLFLGRRIDRPISGPRRRRPNPIEHRFRAEAHHLRSGI